MVKLPWTSANIWTLSWLVCFLPIPALNCAVFFVLALLIPALHVCCVLVLHYLISSCFESYIVYMSTRYPHYIVFTLTISLSRVIGVVIQKLSLRYFFCKNFFFFLWLFLLLIIIIIIISIIVHQIVFNIFISGHVDAGKSTISGQIL